MYDSNDWIDAVVGRCIKVFPTTEFVDAEVVNIKNRERNSYGEYEYGDDSIHVVFEVNGRFFKKEGRMSSYGDESWNGSVTEVFPKTQTVYVFE